MLDKVLLDPRASRRLGKKSKVKKEENKRKGVKWENLLIEFPTDK